MRAASLAALAAATSCLALRLPQQPVPQRHAPRRSCAPLLIASSQLEERIQETVDSNTVVIFSKSWCPYCAQCKALFDDMSIAYTAIELDQMDDGAELQATLLEMTQQRTVPNVYVAGQHLGGNDDTQQAARSGKLAALLEAKSSSASATLEAFDGRVVPVGAEASTMSDGAKAPLPPQADPIAQAFSMLFSGGSGKEIFFGVLQRDVDPASVPSDEQRQKLREAAANDLINIGDDERERRRVAGTAMGGVTLALATGLLVSHAAPLARLAIAPPLFLSYGYLRSAQTGL